MHFELAMFVVRATTYTEFFAFKASVIRMFCECIYEWTDVFRFPIQDNIIDCII